MKIDPTLKTVAVTPIDQDRVRSQKHEPAPARERSDVKVSPLAAQLREIESAMEATEAVDMKRVAEIKRAMAEGTFEVNAEKVADKLIESTREVLRAGRG